MNDWSWRTRSFAGQLAAPYQSLANGRFQATHLMSPMRAQKADTAHKGGALYLNPRSDWAARIWLERHRPLEVVVGAQIEGAAAQPQLDPLVPTVPGIHTVGP